MKAFASASLAICFAALTATAVAGPNASPPTPQPDKGNQVCDAPLFVPNSYPNPGFWFQAIKEQVGEATGGAYTPNIAQWFDTIVNVFGNPYGYESPGDSITGQCDNVPAPF